MYDDKQLDDLLDRGLREYSRVNPRDGLEQRVLANLRAQPEPRPWWRMWVPALAAAAVIVVVVALAIRTPKPQPTIAHTESPAASQPTVHAPAPPAVQASQAPSMAHRQRVAAVQAPGVRQKAPQRVETAQALPRLDTFPSSAPITEEEKLLMSFYRSARGEAIEVAQSQSSERQRVEKYFESGEPPQAPPAGPKGRD